MQPDGKIVAAGSCDENGRNFCVARYLANGLLDTAGFGAGTGRVITAIGVDGLNEAYGLTLDTIGRILVSGQCATPSQVPQVPTVPQACFARYTTTGALDTTFNGSGTILSFEGLDAASAPHVALQRDGKIVSSGPCGTAQAPVQSLCVVRRNDDGSLDSTFAAGGVASAALGLAYNGGSAVIIQSDNKIITAGTCVVGVRWHFCAARFSSNGTLDESFGQNGGVVFPVGVDHAFVAGLVLLPNGQIVLGGSCWNGTFHDYCLVRLTQSGAVDASFGTGGTVITPIKIDYSARAGELALQQDGKLVLAGRCESNFSSPAYQFCFARYNADGSLDTSFNLVGTLATGIGSNADWGSTVALQADGKILAAGNCVVGVNPGGNRDFCLVRLLGGPYPTQNCALNADANLVTSATSDALLITRYLLGIRGDALGTSALGLYPTRTGQALETYLASLDLDADGDGQSLAMTDGLLILRAMLGLTGDALTQGATNAAHPNVRNAQQVLSWIESTHGVACLP